MILLFSCFYTHINATIKHSKQISRRICFQPNAVYFASIQALIFMTKKYWGEARYAKRVKFFKTLHADINVYRPASIIVLWPYERFLFLLQWQHQMFAAIWTGGIILCYRELLVRPISSFFSSLYVYSSFLSGEGYYTEKNGVILT